jgi:hypothetical protein
VIYPRIKFFIDLPSYVSWEIWLRRNQTLFKDKSGSPKFVAYKIKVAFKEIKRDSVPKVIRTIIAPMFDHSIAWSYLNGTIQGSPTQCGI